MIGACPQLLLLLTEMTTDSLTEEDHSTLIFKWYLIIRNIAGQDDRSKPDRPYYLEQL